MYRSAVIVSLVLLLSVTTVVGTEDEGASNELVSQEELAAVRIEMERRVDQLHSQLHYWQNVTVNILKDHYSQDSECVIEREDAPAFIFNITQNNNEVKTYLEDLINTKFESLENYIDQKIGIFCYDPTGSFINPADNCSHIRQTHPTARSGHYWLQSSPGYAVKVFCNMEGVCGCSGGGGGWMRVAHIDMTQPNENCPAGFRKVTAYGKTMCGGQGSGCISTTFPPHGLQYSRVCGRITGYQYGGTEAFWSYINNRGSIDSNFVDGIILTHGSPRTHIWTFACGYNQYGNEASCCPCNSGSFTHPLPPYIGNDCYFCDSGHRYDSRPPSDYLTNDPLWDGAGCVSGSCCTFNSPPWFCKTLPHPTTDDIELRQCISGALNDEDVLIEKVELYVQ